MRAHPLGVAAFALFLAIAWGGPVRAAAPTDDDCLTCHGEDVSLSMDRGGKTVSLYVKASVLKASAHAKVRCIECHAGFDPEETPHKARIRPIDCRGCHEKAKHPFHAGMIQSGKGPSCKSCHGTHDVAVVARLEGAVGADTTAARADRSATCVRCHEEEAQHFARSAHGRAAAAKQPGAPTCVTCHEKAITAAANGGEKTAQQKLEQEKLCLACHLDDPAVRARVGPKAGFIRAYETSIHGAELAAGNEKSATCIDCHGSHDMAKGFEPEARTNKRHIPETCGACHGKVAKVYHESVHGKAATEGNLDSPVCTDCHGEHTIQAADAPGSPVAPGNVSAEVCSPCHSSVRLAAKYGLRSDRFRTFSDSFHGLAIRGGQVSAANCASCHGSHEILPSSDPRSLTHPGNLAKTCGECHAGATAAFASGKVHLDMASTGEPLLYWIAMIYTILIVSVVGGMFVHNALDFFKKARYRIRVRRGLEYGHEPASHALYVRMTVSERIQHGALILSFTTLVVTGFMLRYPESWWVEWLRRAWSNLFEARSVIHRVAGVLMVAASIFHVYYLAFTARGREFFRDMLPGPGDLKDVWSAVRYYAGLSRERPRFGRFSYVEKSEYWALVWGTIVMAVTGVILWFQDPFIAMLSKLGWDAARSIHFYEAILATLAIVVWHLYFVIFNPDVYPMNVAWLKGTLTEEEMEDEHPRELETLRRKEPGKGPGSDEPNAPGGKPWSDLTSSMPSAAVSWSGSPAGSSLSGRPRRRA